MTHVKVISTCGNIRSHISSYQRTVNSFSQNFLKFSVKQTCQVIHWASFNGHLEIIKELLQLDPTVATSITPDGFTALMFAAACGHVACVEYLLNDDAVLETINDQNQFGSTALIHAASNGHAQCMQILIAKGANVNKQTKEGYSA